MRKHYMIAAIALAVLMLPMARTARAQGAAPGGQTGAQGQAAPAIPPDDESEHLDGWYRPVPKPRRVQKSGPAPMHDISGTWEPANGWRNGVQASGAYNYPSDGKHFAAVHARGRGRVEDAQVWGWIRVVSAGRGQRSV